MAFKASKQRSLNTVSIISRYDDAVDHDASDWDRYDEDPVKNADALVMKPDAVPTKFLCNFELSGRETARVKDAMIGTFDREEKQNRLAYGRWAYTVCKMVLKDIQNPPGETDVLEYKKDGTGYVLESVLDVLVSAGVADEIFAHYNTLTKREIAGAEKN